MTKMSNFSSAVTSPLFILFMKVHVSRQQFVYIAEQKRTQVSFDIVYIAHDHYTHIA